MPDITDRLLQRLEHLVNHSPAYIHSPRTDSHIYKAVCQFFGDWESAIKLIDVEIPEQEVPMCPRDLLLNELKEYVDKNPERIDAPYPNIKIYKKAKEYFGSWTNALSILGIERSVKSRQILTNQEILDALDNEDNIANLYKTNGSLYRRASNRFGSLYEAAKLTKKHKEYNGRHRLNNIVDPLSIDTKMTRTIYKDYKGYFIRDKQNMVKPITAKDCITCFTPILSTYPLDTKQCSMCIKSKRILSQPPPKLLEKEESYTAREGRHQPIFNLISNMINIGGLPRSVNGGILSLPSSMPWHDKARLDYFFHDASKVYWYESIGGYNSIKKAAKDLNTVLLNKVYETYNEDILKSRHTNVGVLNLDLECNINQEMMEDVYEIVIHALKGRRKTGLLLNTSGRGPKGMTLDKRDECWNDFIDRLTSEYNITYNSGRMAYKPKPGGGTTMFLFGAVIAKS